MTLSLSIYRPFQDHNSLTIKITEPLNSIVVKLTIIQKGASIYHDQEKIQIKK